MNRELAQNSAQAAYASKDPAYFSKAIRECIDTLPIDPNAAILELGCGDGATGELALREGRAGSYVGIELFAPMAARAEAVLTAVHVGDVEMMTLPYAPQSFDVLICSEVLEHLKQPEVVLECLVKLLRVGGRVYASSPNVAHWKIVAGLLRGRFDYADSGPMDRTHIRWFTPRSFASLFEDCGIFVDHVGSLGSHRRLKSFAAMFPFGHLTWSQIAIRGYRRV